MQGQLTRLRCFLTELSLLMALVSALSETALGVEPGAVTLERGKLLVANEGLNDPNFDSSVVLIVGHGNLGTLGLIVNRRYPAAEAIDLPERYQDAFAHSPQYFGGPVPVDGLRALVLSEFTIPNAIHIKDQLYFLDNAKAFDYLREDPLPAHAMRVYRGIASWIPGQLAAEIRAGAWYVLDGRQNAVFSDDENLWEDLISSIHAQWVNGKNSLEYRLDTDILLLALRRHSIMPSVSVANSGSVQAMPSLNSILVETTR